MIFFYNEERLLVLLISSTINYEFNQYGGQATFLSMFPNTNKGCVLEPNCTNAEESIATHGWTTSLFHCSLTAAQMDGAGDGWVDGKSSISSH